MEPRRRECFICNPIHQWIHLDDENKIKSILSARCIKNYSLTDFQVIRTIGSYSLTRRKYIVHTSLIISSTIFSSKWLMFFLLPRGNMIWPSVRVKASFRLKLSFILIACCLIVGLWASNKSVFSLVTMARRHPKDIAISDSRGRINHGWILTLAE